MANNADAIDLMNENQRLRDVNTKLVEALDKLLEHHADTCSNRIGKHEPRCAAMALAADAWAAAKASE